MTRRSMVVLATSLCMGFAGCSDDGPLPAVDVLPEAPQIMPNAQEGVIGFPLTIQSESPTLDAVFVNGGKDALVISSAQIVDDTDGVFSVVQPESLTVESRRAIGFPITFTSPGRGVYLGRFVVDSNAENFPTIELQLVAPGAGLRVPEDPDIEPFETSVEIQAVAGLSVPAALVRIYNLGGKSLELQGYTLSDTTNFRFLDGTTLPGAVCNVGGVCVPVAGSQDKPGCCGSLTCTLESTGDLVGACSPVLVARGRFILFGVTWATGAAAGAHSTELSIASNDPKVGREVITVTVHGTK